MLSDLFWMRCTAIYDEVPKYMPNGTFFVWEMWSDDRSWARTESGSFWTFGVLVWSCRRPDGPINDLADSSSRPGLPFWVIWESGWDQLVIFSAPCRGTPFYSFFSVFAGTEGHQLVVP